MSNQTEIERVKQLNTNVELIDAQRQTIRSVLAQRLWLINMIQKLRDVVRLDMYRLVEACGKEAVRNQIEWNKEWDEVLSANYPGPEFPDLDGMAIEYEVNPFITIVRGLGNDWNLKHESKGILFDDGWGSDLHRVTKLMDSTLVRFSSPEAALSWVCEKHPDWLVQPERIKFLTSQVDVDNLGSSD